MTAIADVVQRVQQIQQQLAFGPIAGAATKAGDTRFAAHLAAALGAGAGTAPAAGLPPGAGTGGPTGGEVVAAARAYLGIPYVFGGTDPATGLDCSGLVQRVYADLGINLPRIAADQARAGTAVPGLEAAKPGDLLAFNSPVDHIGIYIGNGQMIAAPQPGEQVKVQDVYQTPTAIRRIIPDPPVPAALRPAALSPAAGAGLGAVPYGDLFTRAAAAHGVPAALLAAVAKVESGYDPTAVSPAGARGLMQFMPGTAAEMGINPLDPAQAVDGAARLLRRHLDDFGSVPLALAAYNAGPGAVRQHGGIPPYAETRAYVPKVRAAMTALGAEVTW